jgi:hypothetical protein
MVEKKRLFKINLLLQTTFITLQFLYLKESSYKVWTKSHWKADKMTTAM